ncbi:MAG: hypothetical protein H2044_01525 [Rhizobiales bacterium]|nr:hypothetical protein [Hyphomicrobiales bacterium]
MQQLGFRFEPVPAAIAPGSTQVFYCKLDKSGRSFIEIGVKRNSDGTWSRRTADNFHMWCGHGGPFYAAFTTFDDALAQCVRALVSSYRGAVREARDGVQTEAHRSMARHGLRWLEDLASEYQIDLDEVGNSAVLESPAEQDMK